MSPEVSLEPWCSESEWAEYERMAELAGKPLSDWLRDACNQVALCERLERRGVDSEAAWFERLEEWERCQITPETVADAIVKADPSIRLAILFGSYARGEAHEGSDIDLVIDRRQEDCAFLYRVLAARLGRHLDFWGLGLLLKCQALFREGLRLGVVPADRQPNLIETTIVLHEIFSRGIVLVDRDGIWPELQEGKHAAEKHLRVVFDLYPDHPWVERYRLQLQRAGSANGARP